ncbi:MAG TPA: AAA family ATPase [Acidilobales archaeon]|nr:AAA family ATPase [Acidilobales archaeon]
MERVRTGIEPLDFGIPEGIPRTSTIIIAGAAGTGKSVFLVHIAKNFMERGEKVVYLTLDDSPKAILEMFESFGWDVRGYVSKGLLLLIDGFSFRLKGFKVEKRIEGVVREVRPDDLDRLLYVLTEVVDSNGLKNSGLLVIDSLNELMFRFDLTQVLDFVRSVRAVISKGRGVISLITLHTSTESLRELAAHLEYLVDGVIATRIEPDLQELGIPVKQLMVRKMRGAPTNPLWIPYVIVSDGIRGVDPNKLASLIRSKLRQALITTRGSSG